MFNVEDWGSELQAQLTTCPSENSLVNLTEVHTRRHTEWVQTDIHDCTILQEWHILVANNLRYDTLVTVATCHLITYLQLTLLSDINLRHLDNSRLCNLIAIGEVRTLTLSVRICLLNLDCIVIYRSGNQLIKVCIVSPAAVTQVQVTHCDTALLVDCLLRNLVEHLLGKLSTRSVQLYTEVILDTCCGLTLQQSPKFRHENLGQ